MSAHAVTPSRVVGIGALVIAALGPFIFSNYIAHTLLTQVFWLGIAAASLIFLSAYGGMVSLCQISMFGIAGFVVGNTVTTGEVEGPPPRLEPLARRRARDRDRDRDRPPARRARRAGASGSTS